MKTLLASILAALALTTAVHAQTNTPQGTFFSTVGSYFTSFNTNLDTFTADKLNFWTGTDNVDNRQLAASLGLSWTVWDRVSLEAIARNATVAGTLVSAQAGIGYSLVHYDTKVTGYLHAGKKFDDQQGFVAPGIRVLKALTPNTFAGVSLELPIYFNHAGTDLAPTLGLIVGFKL